MTGDWRWQLQLWLLPPPGPPPPPPLTVTLPGDSTDQPGVHEREGWGGAGGSDRGVSLLLPTGFISHGVNSDIIHGDHTEKEEEKCTVMLCGSTSPR